MSYRSPLLALALLFLPAATAPAQEKLFSGPQPGEALTSFKAVRLTPPPGEFDPAAVIGKQPGVLVFLHGIERSLVPLLNYIDEYGVQRPRLKVVVVGLSADRTAAEQRFPAVNQSLRLASPLTLSPDGAEGPGNYGLNSKCLMTVLVAKEGRITASFALVQPGIADAPAVGKAIAGALGEAEVLAAEALLEGRRARTGMPGARGTAPAVRAPLDPARLDLNTPEGLREAVRLLLEEVTALRRELAEVRQGRASLPTTGVTTPTPARPLPGAAPTDPRLLGLLRSFIQPTNDAATVDRVLRETEAYVMDDAGLRRQAIDGWTRVLAIPYGTEYAQRAGKAFVEKLQSRK